jgi:tape measure domain-containing protein
VPTETLKIVITVNGDRVARKRISGVGQEAKKTESAVKMLKRSLQALGGAFLLRELGGMLDSMTNIRNRLNIFTRDAQESTAVMNKLFVVANKTRTSFEATAKVYARMALATADLGLSQRELIIFQERLNKATIISGARTQEANAAMIQLSQGLAAGALRGDELRSVLEQLPYVADVIARGMGKTRGELKKMGEAGLLTTKDILAAFEKMDGDIKKKFAKTIPTLAQSFEILKNNTMKWLDSVNRAIGLTDKLSASMKWLGENIADVMMLLALFAAKKTWAFSTGVIKKATIAVVNFGKAFLATPFGAMATVVAGLALIYDHAVLTRQEAAKLANTMHEDLVDSLVEAGVKGEKLAKVMGKIEQMGDPTTAVGSKELGRTLQEARVGSKHLDEVIDKTMKYKKAMGDWQKSTVSATSALVKFASIVKNKAVGALKELGKSFKPLRKITDWLGDVLEGFNFTNLLGGFFTVIDIIIKALGTVPIAMHMILREVFNAILFMVGKVADWIARRLNWMIRKAWAAGKVIWRTMKGVFERPKELKGAMKGMESVLQGYQMMMEQGGEAAADAYWGAFLKKQEEEFRRKFGTGEEGAPQLGQLDVKGPSNPLTKAMNAVKEWWNKPMLGQWFADATVGAMKEVDKDIARYRKPPKGRPGPPGKPDLAAAKKRLEIELAMKKAIDDLERSMNPMLDALREQREIQSLLHDAQAIGLIDEKKAMELNEQVAHHLRDRLDPTEAILKGLRDETALLKMDGDELERHNKLLEIQQTLKEAGLELDLKGVEAQFGTDVDALRNAEKAKEGRTRLLGLQEAAVQLVNAAEKQYVDTVIGLDMAMEEGLITMEQYTKNIELARQQYHEATRDADGFKGYLHDLNQEIEQFDAAEQMTRQFVSFGEQFIDTVVDMEFAFDKLIKNMIKDITRLFLKQLFYRTVLAALGGPPGVPIPLPGRQYGGSWKVPNTQGGGPDSEVVAFRASPGETITATPQGQVGQPGSAQTSPEFNVRVVNQVDPNMAIDAMSTPAGDRVILNSIRLNAAAVRRLVK